MENLPRYAEGQLPQSSFDALLIRIAGRLNKTVPEARAILESFVEGERAPTYRPENDIEPSKPIEKFPRDPTILNEADTSNKDPQLGSVKRAIVFEFFDAIFREDNEIISLLIQYNIVTANTTSQTGKTPLLEAILSNNLSVVKQLLELGADPNALGAVYDPRQQEVICTPLMLAVSSGSLPLVKLLFEPPHSADDSLIAPDGQIALRLAADNGHRTIVDYLPSRRGGNYLRFKVKNAENIARVKKALKGVYHFVQFFVWELPRFFLWSIPKHVVVLPVVDIYEYCWSQRKVFGAWCKRQAVEVPKRIWRTVKKVPKAIEIAGKSAWGGRQEGAEGNRDHRKEHMENRNCDLTGRIEVLIEMALDIGYPADPEGHFRFSQMDVSGHQSDPKGHCRCISNPSKMAKGSGNVDMGFMRDTHTQCH